MKFRKSTIAAFLAVSGIALAVPFAVQARQGMMDGFGGGRCDAAMDMRGGHHGARHGGDGMLRGLRALDLSDEQRDRIFELKHALAPKMREQMKTVRATSTQLRELAAAESYDEARVAELTGQRAEAMAQMAQLRLKNQHEVLQVLTPEQRTQLNDLREKRGGGRGWHRGPMGPGEGFGPRS